MAPDVNVKVYVGPNGGTGRSTPTRPWSTTTSVRGDHHQLGPVRGADGAGLHPGRVVALRAGRGPGPDRRRRGGRRGLRGLLPLPELHTTRASRWTTPAASRGSRAWGAPRSAPSGPPPTRVGVELRVCSRAPAGAGSRRCGPCRHGNAARACRAPTPRPRDAFTGAQPCPTSSGAGTLSCREVPDVAADADPRTGFAIFCSCFSGGLGPDRRDEHVRAAVGGAGRAGRPGPALARRVPEPRALPGAVRGEPRRSTTSRRGTTNRSARPRATRPDPPPGPYYPATPGYDLAIGPRHPRRRRAREPAARPAPEHLPRGDARSRPRRARPRVAAR